MKLMKIAVGAVALVALAVVLAASPTQVQPTKAFASELTIDKSAVPVADYCRITCSSHPNGSKYCGISFGQIGCHHINAQGNCIFVLCPGGPPPIEE